MPVGILQKAVNELNETKPRLDYIRGLLETLIEISPKAVGPHTDNTQNVPSKPAGPIRIGKLPDAV